MSEPIVRLACFIGVFLVMAGLEALIPKRTLAAGRRDRWATNLTIVALGSLAVRALAWLSSLIAVPLVAVLAAEAAQSQGWGLLNAWSSGADWPKIAITLLALDLAIYLQHVASHKVPMLWRLHRMHHADVDFDVTTAIRFHPIEIALSMLYKVACVLALGAPAMAVVSFEVLLNACAMFNHANVDLPAPLERALRLILVTPDMHRVHHSVIRAEHDSNYGFNLSVWDRLFATYTAKPRDGQRGMAIGLSEFPGPAPSRLGWCLALPFRGRNGSD